jgi:hypothetical protein
MSNVDHDLRINVEVYLRICVILMFTLQCRRLRLRHVVQQISQTFVLLPDLYLGHASAKLMRYHFESHVTQILITIIHYELPLATINHY